MNSNYLNFYNVRERSHLVAFSGKERTGAGAGCRECPGGKLDLSTTLVLKTCGGIKQGKNKTSGSWPDDQHVMDEARTKGVGHGSQPATPTDESSAWGAEGNRGRREKQAGEAFL